MLKVIAVPVLVLVLFASAIYARDLWNSLERNKKDLVVMHQLFQQRKVANYDLCSFDNGQTWAVISSDGMIVGEANQVFGPSSVQDKLSQAIEQNYVPRGWWENHFQFIRNKAELEWLEHLYVGTSGGGLLTGDYHLASRDKQHWIALDKDRHVLGEANQIHPGLLDKLAAIDAMTAEARKHGNLLASEKGIDLLRKAGFTVKTH